MTIDELREERTKLEAEILRLCEEFKVRTGLTVVALGAETGSARQMDTPDRETYYLLGVRVKTEQI